MIMKMQIGETAPDFSLPGTDENIYSLSSFSKSELLVTVFSCNHCPYVQAYEKRLIALQDLYDTREVRIIAINANDAEAYPEDSYASMQERAKTIGYNFPYLHDASQETAKQYTAEFTPEVFVFNQERKLCYYGKIDDNWNNPEKVRTKYLQNAIEELLLGKPVSVPETYAIGCTIKWR